MSGLTISMQGEASTVATGDAVGEFIAVVCRHAKANDEQGAVLTLLARILPPVLGMIVHEAGADQAREITTVALEAAITACAELAQEKAQIDAAAPAMPAAEGLH